MDKFLLSTPGLIITGNGCLAILWIIGKLLGASFFFIAVVVIIFLTRYSHIWSSGCMMIPCSKKSSIA